jgi:GMP synthase-like glutamine amidotransferase
MDRKVAIFQHVPNEPAGYLETIFQETGIPFEYIHIYETNEVPRLAGTTHLLFMGGPMSVNDEKELPWLVQEKELIRRSKKDRRKVLGICLGAQLIASAYGGKVYPFVRETGWHTLTREPDATSAFRKFPEQFRVFQLHGETFTIPYGGTRLARGSAVKNQALRIHNAVGLQFHLEMTEPIIRDWSKDLSKHERAAIARDTPRFIAESNRLCRIIAGEFMRM